MFDHTAVIAAETDRFAAAIRSADQQAPVPTCPDWTVADLAGCGRPTSDHLHTALAMRRSDTGTEAA